MPAGELLEFGPFRFDTATKRLSKNGAPVALGARLADLLCLFVTKAGQLLSKDLLIAAGWPDVAVTDNSLEQAISNLRRILTHEAAQPCIETLARRGYRFTAPVTRVSRRETTEGLEALLAPHRAWIEGRAALETLKHDQIVQARAVFERVLLAVPNQAAAHVGFANACALQFEMTRSDRYPDTNALSTALQHATEACRLDPDYGEAWATLGFVLERVGRRADALAASRRAVSLEADNWRHHLRLSYASWGEERLREARRALALLPGFPLAHWLAATVYVARQALSEAERELDAGLAAQAAQGEAPRFSGIALHWLLGLVHLSRGDTSHAREEFERELSHEASGHLYVRECCANTWYAMGALRLRQDDRSGAGAAFREALTRVPHHPLARVGLAAVDSLSAPEAPHTADEEPVAATNAEPRSVDRAIVQAVQLVLRGARAEAATLVDAALMSAPDGSAGWLLPIEPILCATSDLALWGPALSRLRNGAA